MVRCMTKATTLMICCISPMWYMMAKKAETKMIVGRTAKAKHAERIAGDAEVVQRRARSHRPSGRAGQ